MDCEKVCEQICSYLDDEMEPKTKKSFEEHIANCKKCSNELDTCSCIKTRVQKGLRSVKAPDFLKQRISKVLENSHNYRESGIPILDLVKWGTHVAQLYKNKSDLSEILIPYITKGLEENEKALWITSEISVSEAANSIVEAHPNIETYLDNGQLEIFSHQDWYMPNGHLDNKAVIDASFNKYESALTNGYSGLRVVGTAQWMQYDRWDALIDLEELIDKSISNEKILLICTYKHDKSCDDRIADVINHHGYLLFKSNGSWELKKSCTD